MPGSPALIHSRRISGFTLIEIIFVLVILGVVSVFGGRFIYATLEIYQQSQQRALLALQAATITEQLTRELRGAAPASVRVSDNGLCVAFLPALTAILAHENPSRTQVNGGIGIETDTFTLVEPGRQVLIQPLASPTYQSGEPRGSRIYATDLQRGTHNLIRIEPADQFLRDLTFSRIFITTDPVRYCLKAGELYRYADDVILDDDAQSEHQVARRQLVAQNLVAGDPLFAVVGDGQVTPQAVRIDVTFARKSISFRLRHKVSLFNGP